MKTRDLRDKDLDSNWTPAPFSGEFGLHVDSRKSPTRGDKIALTRAVDPPM
jgi:hypothetical protein